MASVSEHYASLLAPIYAWMAGGLDASLARGRAELEELGVAGSLAVDLGAGFGMHSIPLAQAGWKVLAVDSSPVLLSQLAQRANGLPIRARWGDLLQFPRLLAPSEQPDLVLCMGDTLTHLEGRKSVAALARAIAGRLAPQGRFIATFRDYSQLPQGDARFIPVHADDERILTCFLEDAGSHVQVHDLLHERQDGRWNTRVGTYRKLRLAPEDARTLFEESGLRATINTAARGMVRLTAGR